MTLKQLIKLEDKAKEVWVVSPGLHYDVESKDFSEIVSVNRGEKTKYRYIVPATSKVKKNMALYQKMYKLSKTEMDSNFLLLPATAFNPFLTEMAVYDASGDCIACSAHASKNSNDIIQYSSKASKNIASSFKSLWKTYKRTNP